MISELQFEPHLPLSNEEIAPLLEETADFLDAQHANEFRVRAYRKAASTLREMQREAHDILDSEGLSGLIDIPGIGKSLARSIERLTHTGRLPLLEQLRGDLRPESIFSTVAGIGPKMAELIHHELGIETLVELETAAWDGRLAHVPGMGQKRIRSVRESLAGRSQHRPDIHKHRRVHPDTPEPEIGELLDIDMEYRQKAAADRLVRIAPRRFNPTGEAWLPIMHTHRDDRHYTALYSNTAHAHELQMTHDWVVIYRDDTAGDGRWTVITSRFGSLKGKRIVRGREKDCEKYYNFEASQKT